MKRPAKIKSQWPVLPWSCYRLCYREQWYLSKGISPSFQQWLPLSSVGSVWLTSHKSSIWTAHKQELSVFRVVSRRLFMFVQNFVFDRKTSVKKASLTKERFFCWTKHGLKHILVYILLVFQWNLIFSFS